MGQKLLVNSDSENLLKELTNSLATCEYFYFGVAFVNFSGVQLLLDTLKEAEKRGIQGKIMTSTYLNFTDPKALERLNMFNHLDLRVFVTDQHTGFHTKAYIFEYRDSYKIIIGSSNVTQSALKSNVEWNVEIISKKRGQFVEQVLEEYEQLWQRSTKAPKQQRNLFMTTVNFFAIWRESSFLQTQCTKKQLMLHQIQCSAARWKVSSGCGACRKKERWQWLQPVQERLTWQHLTCSRCVL